MPATVAWRFEPPGAVATRHDRARPAEPEPLRPGPPSPGPGEEPAAIAEISPEGRAAAARDAEEGEPPPVLGGEEEREAPPVLGAGDDEDPDAEAVEADTADTGETTAPDGQKLDPDEERMLKELKARDREVRAHEAAHLAAAGSLAKGGPSYTMQQGPDGQQYAIGGEVQIDTSPGKTPEESLERARRIQAAANAPADPSPQDRAIAAAAAQMASEAQIELSKARQEAAGGADETGITAGRAEGTSPPGAAGKGEGKAAEVPGSGEGTAPEVPRSGEKGPELAEKGERAPPAADGKREKAPDASDGETVPLEPAAGVVGPATGRPVERGKPEVVPRVTPPAAYTEWRAPAGALVAAYA